MYKCLVNKQVAPSNPTAGANFRCAGFAVVNSYLGRQYSVLGQAVQKKACARDSCVMRTVAQCLLHLSTHPDWGEWTRISPAGCHEHFELRVALYAWRCLGLRRHLMMHLPRPAIVGPLCRIIQSQCVSTLIRGAADFLVLSSVGKTKTSELNLLQ